MFCNTVRSKLLCISDLVQYSIQSYINQEMPDLPTYVAFKTPNWRVSVGDFRTSEEASSMLAKLRKAFPGYAKDMFIVKEKINL